MLFVCFVSFCGVGLGVCFGVGDWFTCCCGLLLGCFAGACWFGG